MVFSVPSFVGIGDDYSKHTVRDERSHGKSFVTSPAKQGKLDDATFDKKFKSIHEGDPFLDPGVMERRQKLQQDKKRLTSSGFKYSNPPKKNAGKGNYYGCFNEAPDLRWPHETDYIVPRKGEKVTKKELEKRNVFTAPIKTGTFGVPGTTLSRIGENYVANFYNAQHEQEKALQEKSHSLMKGVAFKGTCRRGGAFDETPNGISQVYAMTKPMAPRKVKPEKKIVLPEVPWKPSNRMIKDKPQTEYREDPYDGFDPRNPPKRKKKGDEDGKAPWKPNNTDRVWYTKSIAFAKLV